MRLSRPLCSPSLHARFDPAARSLRPPVPGPSTLPAFPCVSFLLPLPEFFLRYFLHTTLAFPHLFAPYPPANSASPAVSAAPHSQPTRGTPVNSNLSPSRFPDGIHFDNTDIFCPLPAMQTIDQQPSAHMLRAAVQPLPFRIPWLVATGYPQKLSAVRPWSDCGPWQ